MDLEISPDEEIDITDQNPTSRRTQRSLIVLTGKFMKLIQEAKDGELDLKDVSHATQTTNTRPVATEEVQSNICK